ncbi:spermidine/putrescine ABC transporter substrate-binding protein [Glaciecola sp. SC05]|uniref:polyamine ABC transporter substrate-binding protein n=1 Tax=Glaciecola sp. SC05 TaxID=1987355 RepID=UPI003528FAB6
MPQSVLDDFEAETGHAVRVIYYESEEDARELIVETRGKGMDLVVLSRQELSAISNQSDIFSIIPYQSLANLQYIDPIWKSKAANIFDVGVPWLWGTNGVLYRKDLVELDTVTWMDLMAPPPSLEGKVLMIPGMRDVMASAMLALGESINTADDDALHRAGKLLEAQKHKVFDYKYMASEIVSGQVHMALSYSSDAVEFLYMDDNIVYVLPENKTTIWLDNLAVFETSENKELAFRFIEFVNEPERAAYIADYLGASLVNTAATKFLSEEYLTEPSLNVPREILESAEMHEPFSPELTSKYNAIFYNALRPVF